MSTNSRCSCPRCFDELARTIAMQTITEAPVDKNQKNLLRAYMEPPWAFPAFVVMTEHRWFAGSKSREAMPDLAKKVEQWLDDRDFFTSETPVAVKRVFAGAVAIAAHLIFKRKNFNLN